MSGHGTISHLGGIHHAHQGSMHDSRPRSDGACDTVDSGASFSGPRVVYTGKIKRTQRNFIPASRVGFDGCYVKVEADRGEDLGIVVSKIPAEKLSSAGRGGYRPPSTAGMGGDAGLMSTPTAAISAVGIAHNSARVTRRSVAVGCEERRRRGALESVQGTCDVRLKTEKLV